MEVIVSGAKVLFQKVDTKRKPPKREAFQFPARRDELFILDPVAHAQTHKVVA
jgi:hypothetical protein